MDDKYQIFISYPDKDADIVENLKGRLQEYGIKAWIYSDDKTLSIDLWNEIENKIKNCKVFIYIFSKHSKNALGQQREFDFVLKQIKGRNINIKIFPIILGDIRFSDLPRNIKHINGLYLNSYNIKTCAFKITNFFFPEIFNEFNKKEWKYPKPGQWLQVCKIDEMIEQYFDIGDLLYFRRISPLGLFECYSPKINDLYWIYPPNVCISSIVDEDGTFEREKVPEKFRITTMIMAEYQYYNKKA